VNLVDPNGLEVLGPDFGYLGGAQPGSYPPERNIHPHPPLFGSILDQAHHLELQFAWILTYPVIFGSNLSSGALPPPIYPPYLPPLTDESGARLRYEDVPWWYWVPIEIPLSNCD
jgi:hypothetical protein